MSDTVLDNDVVAGLSELGEGFFERLAALFLTEYPEDTERIELGHAAGDPVRVADAAHRLKGSSAAIGAAGVSEAAQAIERAGRDDDLDAVDELLPALRDALARLRAELERRGAGGSDARGAEPALENRV